jgi:NAD(P)-dependent dehydrogenase (short-subunit alcohol dehydrogenase family)
MVGFEGRVAVVTGAGRGIGRAYARLLAERGASVVVNDLGGSMEGEGTDAGPASTVAGEIVAAGGTAVADANDVADGAGAQALVDTAVEQFGHLDILVNNAGIIRWAGLPEADEDNLSSHLAVRPRLVHDHAAWTGMVEQGYGRIVAATSSGMFGLPTNLAYATAKAGVWAHPQPGDRRRIPASRSTPRRRRRDPHGRPGPVDSPARHPWRRTGRTDGAYLSHERCPVSGEVCAAGAGPSPASSSPRRYLGATGDDRQDVARHWAESTTARLLRACRPHGLVGRLHGPPT